MSKHIMGHNDFLAEHGSKISTIVRLLKDNRQLLLFGLFGVNILGYYFLQLFNRDMLLVHSAVDDMIPYLPGFVYFYIMWYLYVPLMMLYMCFYDRENFYRQCATVFGGTLICIAVFAIIPTTIDFRPHIENADNLSEWICSIIYNCDRPMNVCPSQHCYQAIAVHVAFFSSDKLRKNHKRMFLLKICSLVIVVLICASTMLIKQHSFIDFVASVFLFLLVYAFTYGKKQFCRYRASLRKKKD